MPTYVRVIRAPSHLTLYEREVLSRAYSLNQDEYHPDILDDYRTEDGNLSLFLLDSDQELLPLIICAVVAQLGRNSARGYVLLDESILLSQGLSSPMPAKGNTASTEINDRHYNVQLRTTQARLELAHSVVDKCPVDSILATDMKIHLINFHNSKDIVIRNSDLKKNLGIAG